MRITNPTKGNYFYFSFEDADYQKYGYDCKRFMNVFKKDFTGGRGGQRYYIAKMKCWAIKNDCRQRFNALLQEYFKLEKQGAFFG